jgi:tRNA A37 methylthiotransferase MiaB
VQKVVVKRRNGVRLGQEFDVLIERPIEGKHNLWRGRTSFQAPEIDSIIECKGTIRQAAAGRFVRVRVTSDSGLDLCGDII